MSSIPPGTYESIGNEYYKDDHATCRNFEEATETFLTDNPSILEGINRVGHVLDVGSGRGLAERYLGKISGEYFQIDISSSMLQNAEGVRILGDALHLPFRDESFDTITAFLYDPFNVPEIEREIARVLKTRGTFFGTLPSFEWAKTFRYSQDFRDTEQTNDTYFTLQDGTQIKEPSYVSSEEDIRYRFWVAGFDSVETFGIPATYAGDIPAKSIRDTARLLDDRKPFERLDIVTIVKATCIDKARRGFAAPPNWLRQVISF